MEFIVVVIIFQSILLLMFLGSRFRLLEDKIENLQKELKQKKSSDSFESVKEQTSTQPLKKETYAYKQSKTEQLKKEIELEKKKQQNLRKQQLIEEKKPEEKKETVEEKVVIEEKKTFAGLQTKVPKKKTEKSDFETYIGENLISKIGIAVLVLGIGYFIKMSIDKNWIGHTARVLVGAGVGSILIGIGHFLRLKMKAFSSVLIGGGIAVLYTTFALGHHMYRVFGEGSTNAFLVMTLVTVLAVVLSIVYNRQELAIIAVIGGFVAPILSSSGEGAYGSLFLYLVILNSGMLALAYFRKWYSLNIICFVFTLVFLIYGYTESYGSLTSGQTLIYATIYFLIFFFANCIYNIRHRKRFNPGEIELIVANSAFYFLLGGFLFSESTPENIWGLFPGLLAIFHSGMAFGFNRWERVSKQLVHVLAGLGILFVSLIAPFQFEKVGMAIFWSVQACLLLWLGFKLKMNVLKRGSIVLLVISIVMMFLLWAEYDSISSYQPRAFLNHVTISTFFVILSMIVSILILKKEDSDWLNELPKVTYQKALSIGAIVFLYLILFLELHYQLVAYNYNQSLIQTILAFYSFGFLLTGFAVSNGIDKKETGALVNMFFKGLSVFSIVLYPVLLQEVTYKLRLAYISDNISGAGYSWHYLLFVLYLLLFGLTFFSFRDEFKKPNIVSSVVLWLGSLGLVVSLTAELEHFYLISQYDGSTGMDVLKSSIRKAGYTIVWGISFFVFMVIGLQKKIRDFRLVALLILGVTLIKLFAYDTAGSETARIAGFIILGVLLLVVSFLYQRLKFLVEKDDE